MKYSKPTVHNLGNIVDRIEACDAGWYEGGGNYCTTGAND